MTISYLKTLLICLSLSLSLLDPYVSSPDRVPLPYDHVRPLSAQILATVLHNNTLSIVMPPQQLISFQEKLRASFGDVVNSLLNVDSRQAEAGVDSSRQMIDSAVTKTIGHERLSELVVSKLREWLIAEARAALATMAAAEQEAEAAANEAMSDAKPGKGKAKGKAKPKAKAKPKKGAKAPEPEKKSPPKESTLPMSVARFLIDLGELEEAKVVLESLVKKRQKQLGKTAPDTLDAMSNLAVCIRKHSHTVRPSATPAEVEAHEAEMDKAETLARFVLELREEQEGKEAAATLTAVGNLGVLLHGRFSFDAEHSPEPAHLSELLKQYKQLASAGKLERVPKELRKLVEAEKLMLRQLAFIKKRQSDCRKRGLPVDTVCHGLQRNSD